MELKPFPTDGATAASPCSGARCFIRSARSRTHHQENQALSHHPMHWQGTYSQILAPLGLLPNPVRVRSTSPTCTRTPTSSMEPVLRSLPTWCPPADMQGSRAVPSLVLAAARPWQGWRLVLGLPHHGQDLDNYRSASLLLGHCWATRRPQAVPRAAEIRCNSTRNKQHGKHSSQKENARLPLGPGICF